MIVTRDTHDKIGSGRAPRFGGECSRPEGAALSHVFTS